VYTSGGAIDDPVIKATITATGTGPGSYGPALYYHADGLGTVAGLSNNQDSSTQLTVLDAWGVSLGGQSTPGAQYGYTGREPDEAGLVYMRARYYSPQFGRFVSRDPAGLQGGINAYAYCGNNPTNCTDPSGMLPQSPLGSFVDSSYFGMGTQGVGLSPSIGPSPANFFTDTTVGRALGSMAAPIALFTPNNVNPLTGYIENFNGDNRAAAAIGLMTLGVGAEVRGEGAAIKSLTTTLERDFFSGAKYTDKVFGQIKQGDFHAFPESVKGFQDAGQLSKLTGGDGVVRDMLKIPGEYGGKKGVFEFIKEIDGYINHRLFKSDPGQ
jgi:RHS repeat-associated protein